MASQSFNLIGQEEEQELVAFGTRQSRVPTPQFRPTSRMEEMLSRLVNIQEEAIKSQAEASKSLQAKLSSTDDKLSQMAFKQIEQIAEILDLVDRISTIERSLQGSPYTGSESNSSGACLDGQRALPSSFDHPLVACPLKVQNGQIVRSTTADSCPFTQKLTLRDETESKFI